MNPEDPAVLISTAVASVLAAILGIIAKKRRKKKS